MADETERPLDYDDAKLLNLARAGDGRAFSALYQRHAEAARRLARELVVSPAEVDDVVAETFARILEVLRRGDGPTDAFRCYVLAAVGRVCEGRYSDPRRTLQPGLRPPLDPGNPLLDPGAAGLDDALMVRAFIAQPERWSALLWHLEIEQESPDEVAPMFGLSHDGLAALERRAREGVRQSCLDAYGASLSRAQCLPVAERLAAYLRYQLSEPRASEVALHLSECDACRAIYAELVDLGGTLRRVVAPAILGSVAAPYLSSAGYSAAPAAGPAAALPPVAGLPAAYRADTAAMAWVAEDIGGGEASTGGGPDGTDGPDWPDAGPDRPRRHGPRAGLTGLGGLGWLSGLGSFRGHPRRVVAGAVALLLIAGGTALAITISGQGAALRSHDSRPLAGAGGTGRAATSGHTGGAARNDTPSPSVRTSATPRPTPSPSSTVPATPSPTPTPSSSASKRAAPDVTLSVSANVFGSGHGNMAQFVFQVTDTGRASTGKLTATIDLPSGSSLASFGGGHGHSQWNCQATSSGATCQHAAIAAGAQVSGGILIQVNGSAACGQPVEVTVTSGSASASAESAQDIQCPQGNGAADP